MNLSVDQSLLNGELNNGRSLSMVSAKGPCSKTNGGDYYGRHTKFDKERASQEIDLSRT